MSQNHANNKLQVLIKKSVLKRKNRLPKKRQAITTI